MAEEIGERIQRHRANLRAAGLRPVQIWVPDTRRPGFAEECRRQSRLLRDDRQEAETLSWGGRRHGRVGVRRGDLATIALPGAYGKPRPEVIIQSDLFDEHPSMTILPVTGELRNTPLFRVSAWSRTRATVCTSARR
jgi:hypothetical protein